MPAAKQQGRMAKAAIPGALDGILAWMQANRKGKPTHNRDAIAGGLGLDRDAIADGAYDQLYAAMKADNRFIFRPDNLPASFRAKPRARARA